MWPWTHQPHGGQTEGTDRDDVATIWPQAGNDAREVWRCVLSGTDRIATTSVTHSLS
jgi:hypothetical protein